MSEVCDVSKSRPWNRGGGSLLLSGAAVGRTAVQAQPASTSQDVLPALLAEVKGLRGAMEQMAVDRLAAEEIQLTQELATEQARWTEVNQRLDELERALGPKR